MPRRRIHNEADAANFLADCANRANQGKIKSHELHAITSAIIAYGNLLKQHRNTVSREHLKRELDEILEHFPIIRDHIRRRRNSFRIPLV